MQILAQTIGKDIIICHYPPYVSKWNPIEHRLFCHMHSAMQGVIFSDYNIVKQLIEETKTDTNLKVFARLNLKDYPIGCKVDKQEIDFTKIHFNHSIPELSYRFAA